MKNFALICSLVLVGCQQPSCPNMTAQQREHQINQLNNWSASGTLSVDQAPLSATWTYQHEPNAEQLEISGQGYFDFKATRQHKTWDIQLNDASYHGQHPNEFLAVHHVYFPITRLGSLLIGLPNRSSETSPYGNPKAYQFINGRSEITGYTCLTGLALPSELLVTVKDQTIKMSIHRWFFPKKNT
jgi:outer membrane biogenesis lipoprotein LolB